MFRTRNTGERADPAPYEKHAVLIMLLRFRRALRNH
jgi:hypothetical protein